MRVNKTLIVGYPGRLARAFHRHWPRALCVKKAECDITCLEETAKVVETVRPRLVINCAAFTDIEKCELQPDRAWAVNVRGVRNLAEACRRKGATLVHFSSDAAMNPVNEYSWTKLGSEPFADLTIRAKIYDASHWAWVALKQGRPIQMLTTEMLNPISTTGTVLLTEALLASGLRGVVSAGTLERLSFWQVGMIWANVLGADPDLVQPVEALRTSGSRGPAMFLDTSGLSMKGLHIPTLVEDAHRHKESYVGLMDSCKLVPGGGPDFGSDITPDNVDDLEPLADSKHQLGG